MIWGCIHYNGYFYTFLNRFEIYHNDSIGPLVQYVDGLAVQIGIVSFGYGCGRLGLPGIYSKVDYVLPWIKQMMEYF